MISLTLIQLLVLTLYLGLIIKRYGILPSISDSWYSLPQRENFLFTLFTWGLGIPMLFYGNVWFFLSGSGLSFVGAATQFKSMIGITKEVHYAGALVGILGALIGIWVQWDNLLPLLWFLFLALSIQVSYMKNKIWWQEIVAIVLILWGLLVK
jgi:hypothetical protein